MEDFIAMLDKIAAFIKEFFSFIGTGIEGTIKFADGFKNQFGF